MTRVLFDVNVIVDVLLDRKPHCEAAAALWAAVETGSPQGLLAAHGVTTVHYLVCKEKRAIAARRTMEAILDVFRVAPVDGAVLAEALRLRCPDFEDAVTAAAAREARCDWIVTRDPKGFRGSPVRPLTPEAALELLART